MKHLRIPMFTLLAGLALLVILLNTLCTPPEPPYVCPGYKVLRVESEQKDTVRVSYVCNELILDPASADAPAWRQRLDSLNFVRKDSCLCTGGLELWQFDGTGDVDIIGVVKDPPPGTSGVGGLSLNFVNGFPPPAEFEFREVNQDTLERLAPPCNEPVTVKIAVVDTGVDTTTAPTGNVLRHTAYRWAPAALLPACPAIPPGMTYGLDVNSPADEPNDQNGHGTHINGIIAGVAPKDGSRRDVPFAFLNVKFTEGSSQSGNLYKALCGMYYALDQGAEVINASWGYLDTLNTAADIPDVIQRFLDAARSKNVLVVAGMGNNGAFLNNNTKFWPASFAEKYDNVISVGAVDDAGTKAGFSNWVLNSDQMSLAAWGVDVPSAYPMDIQALLGAPESGMAKQSGTSMATPFVTRTAAVIKGLRPGLGAGDIKKIILGNAKVMAGFRILDHDQAVDAACSEVQ